MSSNLPAPTNKINHVRPRRPPQKLPQKRTGNGASSHRLGGLGIFCPHVNSALVRAVRVPFTFRKLGRCFLRI